MTNPALDSSNLFKKFLCISTIFLFILNLLIASLIRSCLLFLSNPSKTFKTFYLVLLSILSLSFSILLTSLHLLKQSPILLFIFLNNWINAFYFNTLSLLSMNAISETDFIAKFNDAKRFDTSLHSFNNFVF